MYQLTALYNHPEDAAAFDKHYREVHSVLDAGLPGVRKFTAFWPQPGPDGAKPPYHLVATIYWDSEADMQAALDGPEGQEAVADLANYAGAGLEILTGAAEEYV